MQKEYKTIKEISGPLVFVEKTEPVSYGELVQVSLPDGSTKRGQVLDTSHDIVVVQIFEGTSGIDKSSGVKFLGETIKINLSKDKILPFFNKFWRDFLLSLASLFFFNILLIKLSNWVLLFCVIKIHPTE